MAAHSTRAAASSDAAASLVEDCAILATRTGAELVCGGGSESNLAAHVDLDQPATPVTWGSGGGSAHSVSCPAGTVLPGPAVAEPAS